MVAMLVTSVTIAVVNSLFAQGQIDTKDDALQIQASDLGRYSKGRAWTLSVDADAKAALDVIKGSDDPARQFRIPDDKLTEFRKVLQDQKFFDLPKKIGRVVPDGGQRKLSVKLGKKEHELTIHLLLKSSLTGADLDQARRAVRVWMALRGLFDDKDAHDARASDEEFLK